MEWNFGSGFSGSKDYQDWDQHFGSGFSGLKDYQDWDQEYQDVKYEITIIRSSFRFILIIRNDSSRFPHPPEYSHRNPANPLILKILIQPSFPANRYFCSEPNHFDNELREPRLPGTSQGAGADITVSKRRTV
jgi:hypothetical protein